MKGSGDLTDLTLTFQVGEGAKKKRRVRSRRGKTNVEEKKRKKNESFHVKPTNASVFQVKKGRRNKGTSK